MCNGGLRHQCFEEIRFPRTGVALVDCARGLPGGFVKRIKISALPGTDLSLPVPGVKEEKRNHCHSIWPGKEKLPRQGESCGLVRWIGSFAIGKLMLSCYTAFAPSCVYARQTPMLASSSGLNRFSTVDAKSTTGTRITKIKIQAIMVTSK